MRSWILNCLLSQKSIEVSLLRLLSLQYVTQHRHEMLLSLHVISLVAIITLRESKLHEHINVIVLRLSLWFPFKLKQIMNWMVEEDVSLDDFVALDVKLVLR